ncbi:hypothetical protein [Nocardioides sp. Iso805N]|uniref:hypothetical protein n=1 Tax=Nocardioides sp. Iso805N TaxID=1283287 RepID=UPI0012FA5B0D|nr:hypothetical protein [Nocardioides sp. Iso805N]
MRAILIAIGAILASAAALIGLTTTSASAADGPSILYSGNCTSGGYGSAWAFYFGGKVEAIDECPDGHSAVAEWKIGSSGSVSKLWNHSGAGSDPATKAVSGGTIYYRACTGEYGTKAILQCAAWKHS